MPVIDRTIETAHYRAYSKAPFATPLPREGRGLRAAYQDFLKFVKPFPFGQFTPRFWGWAGGTGTSDGVLASLLNAAFHSPNSKLGRVTKPIST
jgi:hypothetical protein